jgi:hypothetical protein
LAGSVGARRGQELRRVSLPDTLFGEGITVLGGKLYQLTWMEHRCLIYDADTLHLLRQVPYEGEGWGLANDGRVLITSDGSEWIRFRDPATMKVVSSIANTFIRPGAGRDASKWGRAVVLPLRASGASVGGLSTLPRKATKTKVVRPRRGALAGLLPTGKAERSVYVFLSPCSIASGARHETKLVEVDLLITPRSTTLGTGPRPLGTGEGPATSLPLLVSDSILTLDQKREPPSTPPGS